MLYIFGLGVVVGLILGIGIGAIVVNTLQNKEEFK